MHAPIHPPPPLSHTHSPCALAPPPPQPTNGLDIESIDALSSAIDAFQGGVVLVSHDMRLLQKVVKQIFECSDGAVTLFPGDITAYKAKLAARLTKLDEEAKAAGKAKPR
jgi:energy-coupling factor transporter ATP-binding protein EcfA2